MIAGHFRGPGEYARGRRGIIASNAHASGGAISEREQSATKGTFAGRASSDVVTFRSGSRASVVGVHSADLNELVRAQRGIVALNAYAMAGANAKREQSATKSTPAGHASGGAVAFRGGAGKLELKPCVPNGIVRRNDNGDVRNIVASANVHVHAGRNHCSFVCTDKSHSKAASVRSRP